MPHLHRARTETETEAEEWTDMGLEEGVSGDLQMQVEAVTSDKNANYQFVIKTGKTMKPQNLIKPQKISAKLINAIKEDPDDPIPRPQAREKSIKVLIDYVMSINTKPKWTRQQWRNFIDTGDVDLSRPNPEYRLIGIEPSVEINLPQVNQAPAPTAIAQVPVVPGDQENQDDQDHDPEVKEEVHQPPPKPGAARAKKTQPAPGLFGSLVGGFPTSLEMTPLLMIHLLLCLWLVRRSLQLRKSPTKKLGSLIWPQQPGHHSGTLDRSWI